MGRQEENQCLIIRGFDPGDRWVGCASMIVYNDAIYARARVLDRSDMKISKTVDRMKILGLPILTEERENVFVCENYRSRPQGFNRFHDSATSKLIGGLQYCVEKEFENEVRLIEPGRADELDGMIGGFFDNWHKEILPLPHWEHVISAWRVVFLYLHRRRPNLIPKLLTEKVQKTYRPAPHVLHAAKGEIVPSAAKWLGKF